MAVPSANISTSLSPVKSSDVFEEFGNKLSFILDGGDAKIGLESTVISLFKKIQILRPGIISKKQISEVLNRNIEYQSRTNKIISPGQLKKHYSPGIPVKLNYKKVDDKDAFIVFGKKYKSGKNIFNLSKKGDLREAGKKLYITLRKIKKLGYKRIKVLKIPNNKIGVAINDRLKKASY